MTLEPVTATSEKVPQGRESQLLDDLTEWIQRHHQQGGEFSLAAISAAGEAARTALRAGYAPAEAFEAGRTAYFGVLGEPSSIDLREQEITTMTQEA